MKEFVSKTLNRNITSGYTTVNIIGKKYTWGKGYIKFFINHEAYYKVETTWGKGALKILDTHRVCAYWNNCYHVLTFNSDFTRYESIRTEPQDFEYSSGTLIESYLNIYGDSHAMLSFRYLNMEHRNLFQFSRTMFRIGRDNQIINFKSDHLSKDRIFCLAYGEVDVRGHIGRQVHYGRHHETVCKELVDAYFLTIKRNITEFKAIIIVAISPPTAQADHEQCKIHSEDAGGPIPFVGTDSDRIIYRNRMNELLKEECYKNNYLFFNPYEPYTRPDGTLKYELSDNCIHIGQNYFIISEFQKLISSID
jgi:hypothetical protein